MTGTGLPCGCESDEVDWAVCSGVSWESGNRYTIEGSCLCGVTYFQVFERLGVADETGAIVEPDPAVYEFR